MQTSFGKSRAAVSLLLATLLAGCGTAAYHKAQVEDESTNRLTVGTVQREIRDGMLSAEVARVMGAPNIVSTDEERREVWIYDKIATERAYSSSQGGINALILGGVGGSGAGGIGGRLEGGAGASSTSQRTLTVIVKFDRMGKVRDFAYHTSRF